MNILVTGGAGYKGILLTEYLLDKGYKVKILDNFMYGYDPILHLVSNNNLSIVKEDVRNDLKKYVKDQDVIIHLAGISGYPACEANPNSAQLINVDATRKLVKDLSKEQGLIYASTTSFYGKSGELRDETSMVEPVSLYGSTKYEAENICMDKDNSIALRFATLFGVSPKMRCDLLLNDFVYKAVADRCLVLFESQSKRTFLHVRDAIRSYLLAVEKFEMMKNNIFNVGDESMNYSKMEITERIKQLCDFTIIDSEVKDLDVRNFLISYDKIKRYGYKIKYTLDEGIKELLKLYSFYRPYIPFKTI
jgi:nucleoside-diphosphate-sugar epimerase